MREALRQAWDEHAGYPANESTKLWCRRLDDLGSALLPIRAATGEDYLATVAINAAEWRILHYVVRQAFTSDMLDCTGDPDSTERVSAPLREAMADAGIGQWRLHRIKDPSAVRRIYQALNTVEKHRRCGPGSSADSTGRIMRRFRNAVECRDESAAQDCLQELRARKLTDVHNVRFLDAWRVARLFPRELASSRELANALDIDERLMPFDLRRVLGASVLEHTVGRLLEEKGAEALKTAMASHESLVPSLLIQRCKTLLTPVGACYRILSGLHDSTELVPQSDFDQAKEAYGWIAQVRDLVSCAEPGDLDPDVATTPSGPQDRPLDKLRVEIQAGVLEENGILFLCSRISEGDRDAGTLFDQWWDQLSLEARQRWHDTSRHTRAKWDAEQAAEQPIYSDWTRWIEAKSETGDFTYEGWPLVADAESDTEWSRLADALDKQDEVVFRENLPILLLAWDSDLRRRGRPLPGRVVSTFSEKVFLTVLMDESTLSSGDSVQCLHEFLRLAIESGINTEAYGQVVGQFGEIVHEIQAHHLLAELVDILELLVDRKQPDVEAMKMLLRAFHSAATRHVRRFDPVAFEILCELLKFRSMCAEEEALRAALPPEQQSEALVAGPSDCPVRDKKILIYTLEAPSGERAKSLIEEKYGAEVRTNADHAASAKLKGALSWADIVICVTRAAQHAATNEIDRVTPKEFLVRPRGKGSSSIVRELSLWGERRM